MSKFSLANVLTAFRRITRNEYGKVGTPHSIMLSSPAQNDDDARSLYEERPNTTKQRRNNCGSLFRYT